MRCRFSIPTSPLTWKKSLRAASVEPDGLGRVLDSSATIPAEHKPRRVWQVLEQMQGIEPRATEYPLSSSRTMWEARGL